MDGPARYLQWCGFVDEALPVGVRNRTWEELESVERHAWESLAGVISDEIIEIQEALE